MIPVSAAHIVALYALVNSLTFCLYAYDKHAARTDAWRIPERTLLVAALFGPFGAYGAMRLLRHKTKKITFYMVPVFMAIHIAGMLYMSAFLFHLSF